MRSDVLGSPHSREPEHEVLVQRDVRIPLRDGVGLATDLFFPAAAGQPLPCPCPALLLRTPYDKHGHHDTGVYYARRGYAVALQDVRGRCASEGTFYPFAHEAPDGYDTVEWLAAQPWCDGQVGTFGQSYEAAAQSALASLAPPHLAAMVVTYGPSSYYHSSMRHNGALELRFVAYAFGMAATSREAAADPGLKAELERAAADVWSWLRPGAVRRGETPLRLVPSYEAWCLDLLTHTTYDEYWRQPGYGPRPWYDQHADVPTLYVGGWYDTYTRGTLENYQELSRRQRQPVHVLMGPWHHGAVGQPVAGDAEFGVEAELPSYEAVRLQWFDHFLRGLPTGLDRTPPVKYFVMGGGAGPRAGSRVVDYGGEWRGSASWPLPEMTPTPFYFHAGGGLSTQPPAEDQACTAYVYDPADPVPTIGGHLSAIAIPPGAYDQRNDPRFPGSVGDSPLADRDDVLVFATEPLDDALELVGPASVCLWVSSDAPDADFTAKLIDVFAEGVALNLTDSIGRLRFRHGYEAESLAPVGQVHELRFELYSTAIRFMAGHRIRVDISSSNYPRFDLNPNTGGPLGTERDCRPAQNVLHHDRDRPSHVVLPVVERSEQDCLAAE